LISSPPAPISPTLLIFFRKQGSIPKHTHIHNIYCTSIFRERRPTFACPRSCASAAAAGARGRAPCARGCSAGAASDAGGWKPVGHAMRSQEEASGRRKKDDAETNAEEGSAKDAHGGKGGPLGREDWQRRTHGDGGRFDGERARCARARVVGSTCLP